VYPDLVVRSGGTVHKVTLYHFEILALLGCYAVLIGSWLLMLGDNLSVLS
jgi:hypothetical protein